MSQLELISPEEEAQFRGEGYLLLRSVLDADEISALLAEVDRLCAQADQTGAAVREAYYHKNSYKLGNALRLSPAFDFLIDHPRYFGKLVSLMGPYIQLMGSEIFVRGAAGEAITGFHTDMGPGLQKVRVTEDSAFLEIKAQLFLTDLSMPDAGNFVLIPTSHRWPVTDSDPLCHIHEMNRQIGPDGELPPGTLQVLVNPGDVLLFPYSLWHAVGPNKVGRTRYSIALRYGQTALRPVERFDSVLADRTRALTPRQRRVLGDFGTRSPSPQRAPEQAELIYGHSMAEAGV